MFLELYIFLVFLILLMIYFCSSHSSGKWFSLHLDELLPSQIFQDDIMTLCRTPVSKLLNDDGFSAGGTPMENDSSWNHIIDTRYLLKSCLQPALAQLQDPPEKVERTTTRLHLLVELFNDMDDDDSISFVKLLQHMVVDLLHQQEHQLGQNADCWVWDQAASLQDILYCGTFRQSLWKHLQAKLCPILTAVLAYIDCDENLELLRPITEDPLSIRKLWLQLFKNKDVCTPEIPRPTRQLIRVMSSNMPGRFQAPTRLPFIWLIHDHIEKLWKKVQQYSVEIEMPAEEALLKQLHSSPLANLLSSDLGSPEHLQLYCHDLVRIQMQLSSSEEHELLSSALHRAAHQSGDQVLSLPSLHIVLSKLRPRFQVFSQLVKDFPDVMPPLLQKLRLGEQQQPGLLDLEAASACLHLLDLQQYQTQHQGFATWCRQVISIQPSMDVILEGPSECFLDDPTKTHLSKLRVHWKRILVVHLFLERMIEEHESAEIITIVNNYALSLWKVLEKCDFSSLQTLKCIINVLRMCNESSSTLHFSGGVKQCRLCQRAIMNPVALPCKHVFCKKCLIYWTETDSTCQECGARIPKEFEFIVTSNIQVVVEKHDHFRKLLSSFFLDVVSRFCFGGEVPPSKDVIHKILSLVFNSADHDSRVLVTRQFSPFEECLDSSPVIRSLLLKLLLQYRLGDVEEYLKTFLEQLARIVPEERDQEELCYMVIRCIEDMLHKDNTEEEERLAETLLRDLLRSPSYPPHHSLDYLVRVAHTRFCLSFAAKLLGPPQSPQQGQNKQQRNETFLEQLSTKLDIAQNPVLQCFLLQRIHQNVGLEHLLELMQQSDMHWLFPKIILSTQIKCQALPDRFLVCGDEYQQARASVSEAIFNGNHYKLRTYLWECQDDRHSPQKHCLVLALAREVALARHRHIAEPSDGDKAAIADILGEQEQQKDPKFIDLCRAMLQDNCAWPSVTTPRELLFLELQLHAQTALTLCNNDSLLVPLKNLAAQPILMQKSFLPTMPDDPKIIPWDWTLQNKARDIITRYICQNGHLYTIGDCGNPAVTSKCPECGVPIGGSNHVLVQGSQKLDKL
uniref:RING-type domain-containing protein n=1 Tax=Eptatretus burgeri TaxID=7764 RepID=A0A8C4X149_EPTBU